MIKGKLYINNVFQSDKCIFGEDVKYEVEREGEEMYRRHKVSGTFSFCRDDYFAIRNADIDDEFSLVFYDGSEEVCRGTFYQTDCTFDEDKQYVQTSIITSDKYDRIISALNDEYNLIDLAPRRESVTLNRRPILQVYIQGNDKISNVIGNATYEIETNSEVDVAHLTNLDLVEDYHFDKISTWRAIRVEDMPNPLQLANGIYYSNGSDTLYQYNGTYRLYINLGQVFLQTQGGAQVSYEGEPVVAQYYPEQPSLLFHGGAHGYESYYHVYARILNNNVGYNIPTHDISSNNFNYTRVGSPLAISICDGASTRNVGDFIIGSLEVQNSPTKYGVNGEGRYYIQPTKLADGTSVLLGDNVMPIGWSSWIPFSFWICGRPLMFEAMDSYFAPLSYELQDAYPLHECISVLLAKIDPNITFDATSDYSVFLYGAIGAIPQQVLFGWIRQKLFLSPITNVKKTHYEQAARKGNITLGQIFNLFRAMQLYWWIDESNRLRFEHIVYFKNGNQYSTTTPSPILDLTSKISPKLKKPWAFGANKFVFDKANLSRRYEFGWNEESMEGFNGYPITINNKYVNDSNVQNLNLANLIADVDLVISAPDTLSDDCFVVIGTNDLNECPIVSVGRGDNNFNSPIYVSQNGYLTFFSMENRLWAYNLSGDDATTETYKTSDGTQDGIIRVLGVKRTRKQEIAFPWDYDQVERIGLIRTMLGDGELDKVSMAITQKSAQASLLFDTKIPIIPLLDILDMKIYQGAYSSAFSKAFTLGTTHVSLIQVQGSDLSRFTFGRGATNVKNEDFYWLRIKVNKNCNLRMKATNATYAKGYLDSVPHEHYGSTGTATLVGGNQEKNVTLSAGLAYYIGYLADDGYNSSNSIEFEFTKI